MANELKPNWLREIMRNERDKLQLQIWIDEINEIPIEELEDKLEQERIKNNTSIGLGRYYVQSLKNKKND